MTDAEFAAFLGIAEDPDCAVFLARMTPERRAVWERIAAWSQAVWEFDQGKGPRPAHTIIARRNARLRPAMTRIGARLC